MAMSNMGLTKVIEECGELITVAAKRIPYMEAEYHPDGSHQNIRLEEEMGDVLAACEFLRLKMPWLDANRINRRAALKLETYIEWDKEPD